MSNRMRWAALAILAGVLFVATPAREVAANDGYWDGYWSWYDNSYQPYYRRHYSNRYYDPGDYGYYGDGYYGDGYYGSRGYYNSYPYYNNYRGNYYGTQRFGYYDRPGTSGAVQVGPLRFGWR